MQADPEQDQDQDRQPDRFQQHQRNGGVNICERALKAASSMRAEVWLAPGTTVIIREGG